MNSLILRLEEIKNETKGFRFNRSVIYAGESGTSLDDFSDGLNLLFGISVDNSRKLDEVWQEMHLLNKNNKASKGGDAA